jgi:hypothetical protein
MSDGDFDLDALDSAIDEVFGNEYSEETVEEEQDDTTATGDETGDDDESSDDTETTESDESNDDTGENPDETLAKENGWKPKDDFKGEGWVDAGEFNRRQGLFDKIAKQGQTVDSLNKKIDALVNHNKKIEANALEKAIKALEEERKEAIDFADHEAVDAADEKINELNKQKDLTEEKEPAKVETEVPEFVTKYAKENPWFDKDKTMTDFMYRSTKSLVNDEKMSLEDAMAEAHKMVQARFADKLVNPRKKEATPAVKSGAKKPEGKMSMKDLDADQKVIFEILRDSGMTNKEIFSQMENSND